MFQRALQYNTDRNNIKQEAKGAVLVWNRSIFTGTVEQIWLVFHWMGPKGKKD